jgi:hypothetical protein
VPKVLCTVLAANGDRVPVGRADFAAESGPGCDDDLVTLPTGVSADDVGVDLAVLESLADVVFA